MNAFACAREIITWPAFLGEVYLEASPVPHSLHGATAQGVLWQAARQQFLLRVPEVADFFVEDGRRVTVDPAPRSDAASLSRFLRMTPLAALLYQRGVLAFHAACATNAKGAILLAGDSGAGKSSLLMALLRRGWMMLADELAVTSLNQEGQVQVAPTFPEVRLWQNAAEKFDLTREPMDRGEGNWHIVSAATQFSAAAQPLRAIYWLGVHNVDRIEQRVLEGMERFRALGTLAYNSHIADALLDRAGYMHQASVIAQTVPIRRLYRPRGKWTVEKIADRIEEVSA